MNKSLESRMPVFLRYPGKILLKPISKYFCKPTSHIICNIFQQHIIKMVENFFYKFLSMYAAVFNQDVYIFFQYIYTCSMSFVTSVFASLI